MEPSLRARIRAGDAAAFEQIFAEHATAVHRFAIRMVGERTDAEDVVSLTFLEAWRLRRKVRPDGGSLQPWLFGIATNVLRNQRRSARRHQDALARLPCDEPVPDFADELLVQMTDADRLARVRDALQRLRPGEREVFVLYVWEGLSHEAVAEILGVRPGTVRSRLSRARTRLRALAEEKPQHDVAGGQVPGDRATADRSIQEKTR